jgi:hypothetical protein
MIIDCCKMTPVQSQYCMFSMIISCHFSHMNMLELPSPFPPSSLSGKGFAVRSSQFADIASMDRRIMRTQLRHCVEAA